MTKHWQAMDRGFRTFDNEALFATIREDLSDGKSVKIRARGWSMLPMIWDERDTLTISPITEESLQEGRILLFFRPPRHYVVHRLVRVEGDRLTFRGDGNPYQEETCNRADAFGELTSIERDGVEIEIGTPEWMRFERYWPRNGHLRRLLLFLYRRLFVRSYGKRVPHPRD